MPTTAFNKDAEFIKIAKINILSEILSFIAVYILYLLNFGIIALVFRGLVQSILSFLFFLKGSKNTTLGRPMFGKEVFHIKKNC
ncbi:oligosaccharide flippase family protein [Photobacterium kishitanii]|uniref:oligosaccharide flippase family protein n=1 Tax=Photobacterium kishitanii TaxID=318456 RepID=UPI00138FD1A8